MFSRLAYFFQLRNVKLVKVEYLNERMTIIAIRRKNDKYNNKMNNNKTNCQKLTRERKQMQQRGNKK